VELQLLFPASSASFPTFTAVAGESSIAIRESQRASISWLSPVNNRISKRQRRPSNLVITEFAVSLSFAPEWQSNCIPAVWRGPRVFQSRRTFSIPRTRLGGRLRGPQTKRGTMMENPLVEMLSWLFVKSEEEIMVEAEVAALTSMFLAEDPRPERPH
jgi:hypothetical protein